MRRHGEGGGKTPRKLASLSHVAQVREIEDPRISAVFAQPLTNRDPLAKSLRIDVPASTCSVMLTGGGGNVPVPAKRSVRTRAGTGLRADVRAFLAGSRGKLEAAADEQWTCSLLAAPRGDGGEETVVVDAVAHAVDSVRQFALRLQRAGTFVLRFRYAGDVVPHLDRKVVVAAGPPPPDALRKGLTSRVPTTLVVGRPVQVPVALHDAYGNATDAETQLVARLDPGEQGSATVVQQGQGRFLVRIEAARAGPATLLLRIDEPDGGGDGDDIEPLAFPLTVDDVRVERLEARVVESSIRAGMPLCVRIDGEDQTGAPLGESFDASAFQLLLEDASDPELDFPAMDLRADGETRGTFATVRPLTLAGSFTWTLTLVRDARHSTTGEIDVVAGAADFAERLELVEKSGGDGNVAASTDPFTVTFHICDRYGNPALAADLDGLVAAEFVLDESTATSATRSAVPAPIVADVDVHEDAETGETVVTARTHELTRTGTYGVRVGIDGRDAGEWRAFDMVARIAAGPVAPLSGVLGQLGVRSCELCEGAAGDASALLECSKCRRRICSKCRRSCAPDQADMCPGARLLSWDGERLAAQQPALLFVHLRDRFSNPVTGQPDLASRLRISAVDAATRKQVPESDFSWTVCPDRSATCFHFEFSLASLGSYNLLVMFYEEDKAKHTPVGKRAFPVTVQ